MLLEIILAIILLGISHFLAVFIGILCTVWNIQDKHPRAYAEIAAKRKRGGKDALSS